jgi:hypothetical protein
LLRAPDHAQADLLQSSAWRPSGSQWLSESSDSGTSRESTDSSGSANSSQEPRKVHIPMQVRSEAVQWLAVRGTPPLLLKATLAAYREQWSAQHGKQCPLSPTELLTEILQRSENRGN